MRAIMENNERDSLEKNKRGSTGEEPIIYRGWKAMPFVIGNETFEKLGAIGTLANLLVYLTSVFNLKRITAATLITIFSGTTNVATLLGAFVTDTYFGRYKTLGFSSIVSFMVLTKLPFVTLIHFLRSSISNWKLFESIRRGGFSWRSINSLKSLSLTRRISNVKSTCLDKAAILTLEDEMNPDGSAADPWRLCSMQQVEEVKCPPRVLPIWAAALVFHIPIVQQQTFVVFQAIQSNRRLGKNSFQIPAASYTVFLMLAMSIWIPIYDRLLVPFLQRLTGKEGGITLLQRIGIGIFLSVIAMLVSGFVEGHRRTIGLTKPIPGIQTRAHTNGLAEAFTSVGQVELYCKQFPENMRSIGGSIYFCGLAGSSYLSSALIVIVHQTTESQQGEAGSLLLLIAAVGAISLGYFLVCAKWYKYKGDGDNNALQVEVVQKSHEHEI
ncbi:unnamed protein product [Malus baccata var. baccata]